MLDRIGNGEVKTSISLELTFQWREAHQRAEVLSLREIGKAVDLSN